MPDTWSPAQSRDDIEGVCRAISLSGLQSKWGETGRCRDCLVLSSCSVLPQYQADGEGRGVI